MKKSLNHSWNLSPKEAERLQIQLKDRVVTCDDFKKVNTVAGVDIGYSKKSDSAVAGIAILSFPEMESIEKKVVKSKVTFPYIPGLLAFREGPLIYKLFNKLNRKPDIIMFDGHGMAHPRNFGIASHLGVLLNITAIGFAKSKLIGEYRMPANNKGATSDLIDNDGTIIGKVLRSRVGCKPVFVSIGHRIGLKTIVKITIQTCKKYRIPEPLRQAHILCRSLDRK